MNRIKKDENGNPIIRTCLNCGVSFPWKRDTKGDYCSHKCWQESKENKQRVSSQFKGKKLSPEHVEKVAAQKRGKKQSAELVERRISKIRGRKQSQEEIENRRAALKGKVRNGESLQNIRDGIAKSYGYSSYDELLQYPEPNYRLKYEVDQKEKAMARDGYACIKCGSTENLQVDHIIDKRRIEDFKQKHALENLITLCIHCHQSLKGYKSKNYLDKVTEFRAILSSRYGYTYEAASIL